MAILPEPLPIDSAREPWTDGCYLLTVQAAMINQITQVTSGTLVLDEVLHSIAQQLADTLQVSGCLIFSAKEEQGRETSWVSVGMSQQDSRYIGPEQLYPFCGEFYQYYHSRLIQGQPVIKSEVEQQLPLLFQQPLRDYGISALLMVPMLYRQSLIGSITLYQCEVEREWTSQEIDFVQVIATQCAIALTQRKLEQRYQTEFQQGQQCELALKESQQRLHAICNQTRQFMGLLTPEGSILEMNRTALDFAGLNAQDMVNRPFWEAGWWLASGETIRQLQNAIATAAAGRCIRYEVNVLGKKAQIATLDFSLKPQMDETGNVVLLIFEGQDITTYKGAQAALATSEARTQALLDVIPDLIVRVHRDGIFLDCKAAKEYALSVPANKVVGRHLHQVLPAQVAGQVWHHVELAIETNDVQNIEFQLWFDGKSRDFEARIVKSASDEVTMLVQDISERVQARVLLEQVNDALESRVAQRTEALGQANRVLREEIIDRKQVEKALRESEQRFRQAVVNAPFPIMIHAEDGEILQINQAWTDLTGYTHDEIPTVVQWIEQAYGKCDNSVRSLIDKLYGLNGAINEAEFAITTKSGEQRIWNFSSAPLGQLNDGRRITISMAADITERKYAESEAHFLHSIAQAIFESQDFHAALSVALQKVCEATGWEFGEAWVPRADGSVLECSPAWFSKAKSLEPFRSASEKLTFASGVGLPGRVWLSQQPEWRPDVSAESNAVYLRAQIAKEVGLKAGLGIPLLTPNGVLAVLVFYMFESKEEDERLIELISASTELGLMVQRKQAEGEIRNALVREKELTELKSRFIAMASHEFRTPLTTILSSSELLEHYQHKWTEEKKRTHLHRIQASVKHMTRLLNDVLIIGKADAGRLEFNPAPLDLENFCRNLVEELQLNDTKQHSITFQVGNRKWRVGTGETTNSSQASGFDSMPFSPTVHSLAQQSGADSPLPTKLPCMDEKLLRQILENLLSNAIKYSPAGSTVEFTLNCVSNQAVFQIRDRGIGIPLEDQQQLFETFHRASNVGTVAGTGLGLAIVKRCVDIHQGQIVMESEIGVGTTFTVTLPIYNSLVRS
jgi:PAS domain S-box-containing protein